MSRPKTGSRLRDNTQILENITTNPTNLDIGKLFEDHPLINQNSSSLT
jgi:hypothetical protein